jgi:hypothetical protein
MLLSPSEEATLGGTECPSLQGNRGGDREGVVARIEDSIGRQGSQQRVGRRPFPRMLLWYQYQSGGSAWVEQLLKRQPANLLRSRTSLPQQYFVRPSLISDCQTTDAVKDTNK